MREWLSGGASPCQGEGRGFDPRLALLFMPKNRDFPLFKSGLSLWVTGYKTLWSEAWCISRWYIVPQTIFCTNGCAGDKVEIPITAVRKSLPKREKLRSFNKTKKRTGKSALIVKRQNPASYLGGKGLFKKRKICKKIY